MKVWNLIGLIVVSFLTIGCSDNDTKLAQGWHFQGRDCLACHNVDLGDDKNLLMGGTIYKSSTVTDTDDMNQVCGGNFIINFLNSTSGSVVLSSEYNADLDSAGYQGKGNIFILKKQGLSLNGSYKIQILDSDSNELIKSDFTHSFNSNDYDITNSQDYSNSISCNACHNIGNINPISVNATYCE